MIVKTTIAMSQAPTKDITISWSATVPTSSTGVVAVFELRTFLIVIRPVPRASGPTYISDVALPVALAATLPQGGCRDGHRQQQTDDDDPKNVLPVLQMLHKSSSIFDRPRLNFAYWCLQKASIALSGPSIW